MALCSVTTAHENGACDPARSEVGLTDLGGYRKQAAKLESREPITFDAHGKPLIPLEPASIYAFGGLLRGTEEALLDLFSQGLLSGTTHTAIGQELCQMSVVRALSDPNDAVLSNHRNHGHFLTYSGQFRGLIEEIMGRQGGVCHGVGGSQHLAYRNFHSNGVQAGLTGVAVGQAFARKLQGQTGIVAIVIGDGTLGQGLVYEGLNLASIWQLPILFVVENNGIAQTTPTSSTIGGAIEARGAAFGLPVWRVDDSEDDFLQQVQDIVDGVRASKRPGFLIIDTMRMGPHSKGDDLRDPDEISAIKQRDPLNRLGARLPASVRSDIDADNKLFLTEIIAAAKSAPESNYTAVPANIFHRPAYASQVSGLNVAGNVRRNLNAALHKLLSDIPEVVVLGEDLHDPYGGAFKVTAGLSTEFPTRVLSTPICEAGIIGTGIGLAMSGMRPIVEVMFADFLTLGMDQLFNQAVKFPGMFPDAQVPLVIRAPSGGRRGYGPTHSQSPENLMCSVPGLTVVFGSQRHAVGELLWRAVMDWPYPTVFFEHKLLYGVEADRRDYREIEADLNDPGAALFPTLVRGAEGADPDVTLVCYGGMVSWAEDLASQLATEELDIEILVPSLLAPMSQHTLMRHLLRRQRIAVLEESHSEYGFGAELGSLLLEAGHRGKFVRIGTPPIPIPAARSLEAEVIPDAQRIMKGVLELFRR